MMSIQQKILDEFRVFRREIEYKVVICELPRDICNIILDYSQLDDGVFNRAINVRANVRGINVSSSLYYSNETSVCILYRLHAENVYMFDVNKLCDYWDILSSCYYRSSFVRILDAEINHKILKPTNDPETSSAINEKIIEFIKWPELNSQSESKDARSKNAQAQPQVQKLQD